MSTYLDTAKIQANGRLSLGPAALRNLGVSVGEDIEIFFDELSGALLLVKPINNEVSGLNPVLSTTTKHNRK